MPSDELLAANRRNRDERVPIHRRDRTGFYAVERFLAGEKRLHAVELGELGDVAGKRLIHQGEPGAKQGADGFLARKPEFAVAALSYVRARRRRHVAPAGLHPGFSTFALVASTKDQGTALTRVVPVDKTARGQA